MSDETEKLTLKDLRQAFQGYAAALRCVTDYQPAGGPGDKVFPPTYEGGKYATEKRWIDGAEVPCVLLDSIQSQANRMELALLDAVETGQLDLSRLVVEFNGPDLIKPLRVTSFEAPHRAADAIFRDSEINGIKFRESELGRTLDTADVRNAAPLFGICPTALIFGVWDSTGPRGGLGAKFQRAIVSEMVGLHAVPGVKTSSRIDPLQIMVGAGPVFKQEGGTWELGKVWPDKKAEKKGEHRPSEVNHGNITPSIGHGGFTISKALQTTVLSLTALRRLRFPLGDSAVSDPEVDLAARVALAAIALAGASIARAQGADLRSRCQLFPTDSFVWELLDDPTAAPSTFSLPPMDAIKLAKDAIEAAKAAGLPWQGEVRLTPSANLLELLRRSQVLAATSDEEGE
ncbi:MAG: type I-G CRISPR-associated RAMP protein Csb1/Cas7g [Thermodesulfobacteriota bacterium]